MYNFITIDWTLVDVLYTNINSLALLYPEILINLNRYWLCNSLIKVVIFGEKSTDKHGLGSVREFCDPLGVAPPFQAPCRQRSNSPTLNTKPVIDG